MAESAIVKNFRDGLITLSDGTGSPVSYTVVAEKGDLKINGLNTTSKSYEKAVYEDRGEVYSVRKTNRKYPSVSFSVHLRDVSDATSGTMIDFLLFQNAYSANVGTLATGNEKTIDIAFAIEGTDFGDSADHTITLSDFLLDDLNIEEGDPNSITVTGRVLGTVVMV